MAGNLWYKDLTNNVESVRMSKPYSQIVIGSDPTKGMTLETAQQFDVFVNLTENPLYSLSSDKPRTDTKYYWVPINEKNFWGYDPFSKSKIILDFHYDEGHSVYLHCEFSANRSPSIVMGWLISRDHSLEEAALIASGGNEELSKLNIDQFRKKIDQGFIPKNLSESFKRIKKRPDLDQILKRNPSH